MAVLQGFFMFFLLAFADFRARALHRPYRSRRRLQVWTGFVSIGLPKGLRGMNAQLPRIHTSQTECKQTGNGLALGWLHGTRGAAGLRTVSDYVVKDPRGATWTG